MVEVGCIKTPCASLTSVVVASTKSAKESVTAALKRVMVTNVPQAVAKARLTPAGRSSLALHPGKAVHEATSQ